MVGRLHIPVGIVLGVLLIANIGALAQTAPSPAEQSDYKGLHAAALKGDLDQLQQLIAQGAAVEARDPAGRTALHVAVFKSHEEIVRALAEAGSDMNALEGQSYDAITIAAVANDLAMMKLVISLGGKSGNMTSPYDGTALIAAAHLGHVEIVKTLIAAGAPLDHVNNLGWTALMEAVVLGDGGPRHTEIVDALIDAGANIAIPDRAGITPLQHAKQRGFSKMVERFQKVARPGNR